MQEERASEIGLRTALVARRRDIRVQFLAEALLLGGCGGGLGIALGLGAAWIVGRTTEWSTTVTAESLVLAVGSSLAIGVVFGVVPAQRAASLDPIAALTSQ